jgi:hypothetical protein
MDPMTWRVLWALAVVSLGFLGAVVRTIWRELLDRYRGRHSPT